MHQIQWDFTAGLPVHCPFQCACGTLLLLHDVYDREEYRSPVGHFEEVAAKGKSSDAGPIEFGTPVAELW